MVDDALPGAVTICLITSITGRRCRAIISGKAICQDLVYRLRAPLCWSECLSTPCDQGHGKANDEGAHRVNRPGAGRQDLEILVSKDVEEEDRRFDHDRL